MSLAWRTRKSALAKPLLFQQRMLDVFTEAAHFDDFTNLKTRGAFRVDSSQHKRRKCSTCKKTRVVCCWFPAVYKTCEVCRSKQRARARLRRNLKRVSNAASGSCDSKQNRHLASTRFCKSCKRWRQKHDFKARLKTCGACLSRKKNTQCFWEHKHVSALFRSFIDM